MKHLWAHNNRQRTQTNLQKAGVSNEKGFVTREQKNIC